MFYILSVRVTKFYYVRHSKKLLQVCESSITARTVDLNVHKPSFTIWWSGGHQYLPDLFEQCNMHLMLS